MIGKYREAMDLCNYILDQGAYELSEENRNIILLTKALSYRHLGRSKEAQELIEALLFSLRNFDKKQELEEKGKLLHFPTLNN